MGALPRPECRAARRTRLADGKREDFPRDAGEAQLAVDVTRSVAPIRGGHRAELEYVSPGRTDPDQV